MAMQSVRLRRVITSLSSLHHSFNSPITPSHSRLPQFSVFTVPSVHPSASFSFHPRGFSWFSAFSSGKDNSSEAKEDSAEGKDDNVPKEEDDGVALSADLDCKDDASEECDDLTLSEDKDAEANETGGLTLTKDKDTETDESEDLILSEGKDAEENASKEENDDSTITKVKDSEDDLPKLNIADWLFSKDKVLDDEAVDSLFKNVKPLSEYEIDDKLTDEDKGFVDIFEKYDIKEMIAKAKEQEKNGELTKEYEGYEGYSFMRRGEEAYPYSLFEDEEPPRVPKNEDDIMEIFAGCDLKHWLITVNFPDDPAPTREEMIATYERVCAEGLGVSIEEAKKRIYSCSTTVFEGFGVEMTREESEKFVEVPEVGLILPDSYLDRKNKEYGGDKYENGVITERPPPFTYKKKTKEAKKGEQAGKNSKKATIQIAEKQGGSVAAQAANA